MASGGAFLLSYAAAFLISNYVLILLLLAARSYTFIVGTK